MPFIKASFAAVVVLGLACGTTRAQGVVQVSRSSVPAAYPGAGTNLNYYAINGGFGNYGLPGTYPAYQGYGFSGYGPGATVGSYFPGAVNAPPASNSMGGLMKSTQKPAGRPIPKRAGNGYSVPRPRPAR